MSIKDVERMSAEDKIDEIDFHLNNALKGLQIGKLTDTKKACEYAQVYLNSLRDDL